MTEAKEKLTKQDRFSYFGEVIACKLRSLNDPRLQAETEFKINTILFEAEMQSLNKQSSYPTIKRSIDTLQPNNSRPGSSITNYSYECSNSTTPEILSPNSETLNKWPSSPTMVRSSDTQLDNSCTGSSTTNYRCELSNILSPNSETLSNDITTESNQNSALVQLQVIQQLDPDMAEFLKFHK